MHEILELLKIWVVFKSNNIMYIKKLLKNWTSSHLWDCPWYLDFPKDNISPYKWEFQKKLDLSYVERLASFEMEARASDKKKNQDGAKEKR